MKLGSAALLRHGVLCLLLSPSLWAAGGKPPEQVIPLTIVDGAAEDPGRVFALPVVCNGEKGQFELGCYGSTRISESFAERCRAAALPDEQLSRDVDSEGKPIFAGIAHVRIEFGGIEQIVDAPVMKDEYCQKPEKEGMLGFDVIHNFQWEVDPSAPSLTLRPVGTPPSRRPLAIVPMHIVHDGYFVHVRIRNVGEDLGLMPASSFVQAGPALQRKWDFNSGKKLDVEVKRFGNVRTARLYGDDVVELTRGLRETNLLVALIGDARHPEAEQASFVNSGLGQCVLNRFVYCIEPRRQQFRIMSRLLDEQGRPLAPSPSTAAGSTSTHGRGR